MNHDADVACNVYVAHHRYSTHVHKKQLKTAEPESKAKVMLVRKEKKRNRKIDNV